MTKARIAQSIDETFNNKLQKQITVVWISANVNVGHLVSLPDRRKDGCGAVSRFEPKKVIRVLETSKRLRVEFNLKTVANYAE